MKTIISLIKFLVVLTIATIVWIVVWQCTLSGHVYDSTDDMGFDYFSPGDWVRGSIEYVDIIDTSRTMDMPDSIKKGWTTHHLWGIWLIMTAFSVSLSWAASKISWAGSH
jgi:hypothetical protein